MNVFVTGATGFVGSHLVTALKEAGHHTLALVRPGSENKLPFFEGVTIIPGDVTGQGGWVDRLKEADAVIHLVGIIREFPSKGITFEKMHNHVTKIVVDAAKQEGVKKFVHMSANGAAPDGVSGYQTSKWRAEEAVKSSGIPYTIFRPSVIFGDSAGKMEFTVELANVIKKAPVMPVFGDGKFLLDPVAVEDVASCFVKALSEPDATGRIFHLGGGHPVAFREIIQIIGKAVGKKKTKTIYVPFGMVKPVAALLGRFPFFPVNVDQLNMLKAGNICPETDYRDVFKLTPKPFIYQNLKYLKVSP